MKKLISIIALFFCISASAQRTCIPKDSLKAVTAKIVYDTTYKQQCTYFFGIKLWCKPTNVIESIKQHTETIYIKVPYDSCYVVTNPPPPTNIIYGIMQSGATPSDNIATMKATGINLVREPVFFSKKYYSSYVDAYLKAGYNVQINFNYHTTSSPQAYTTDTDFIRSQAEKFFQYYLPYKNKIPVVAVENEWDNYATSYNKTGYHTGSIQDYLNELRIVCEVGHKYGFKITDAGITSTALSRWTFSKLSVADAKTWAKEYFVSQNRDDYLPYINLINEYAAGVRNIPIDYINFHWYGVNGCYNGLQTSLNFYMQATSKVAIMTNEFGVHETDLWSCAFNEVQGAKPAIAIAYSGLNNTGSAVKLTIQMLQMLK